MKHCYLIVPQVFAQAHTDTRKECNVMAFAIDKAGRYCISLNAVNEFPEIFMGIGQMTFPVAWLDAEDFPRPDPE